MIILPDYHQKLVRCFSEETPCVAGCCGGVIFDFEGVAYAPISHYSPLVRITSKGSGRYFTPIRPKQLFEYLSQYYDAPPLKHWERGGFFLDKRTITILPNQPTKGMM